MSQHKIIYENGSGNMIGIVQWINQPLDARKSILLYEILKSKKFRFVARLEDFTAFDVYKDRQERKNVPEVMVIYPEYYEDAGHWLKENIGAIYL